MTPSTDWRSFRLDASEAERGLEKLRISQEGMDVRSALAQDPLRVDQLSWQLDGLHLDASKQRWDKETLDGLISLAEEAGVKQAIEDQFSGATINHTG